jgi:DNA replication and repair protein RecF
VRVLNLRLYQYRNFDLQEIELCPGTNLFFGWNGQGKTNLLEALYLLGYGRSFRTATPRDCIQHKQQECALEGKVEHGNSVREIGISISRDQEKQLLLYRKPVDLGEFIGNLHILAFTQEHLKIVRGAPGERRAFLDRAMLTVYPGHMQRLAAYSRTLKQRNRMLAEAISHGRRTERTLLESWDEKLIQDGSRILGNRRLYVDEIKRELAGCFWNRDTLDIRYASTAETEGGNNTKIEEEFRRRLQEARSSDERRGVTSIGPHRDDLKLTLDGKGLGDFGSAGQQRSCLLSLYFAQMEIHRKTCGFYPVFLMDDVEAELDDQRLKAFLDHLSRRTQTFLTTAKEQVLPGIGADVQRYRVCAGKVQPERA